MFKRFSLENFILYIVVLSAVFFPISALADPEEPMKFKLASTRGNCDKCTWISAEGIITSKTPKDFEQFLRREPLFKDNKPIIKIHSSGGNLVGGILLGNLFRKIGANLRVEKTIFLKIGDSEDSGFCYSACAYAFLGGVNRHVPKGSRYGVHQFFVPEAMNDPQLKAFNALDLSASQVVTGMLLEYTLRMGISPKLVEIATTASPWENIRLLNETELRKYQIDNTEPVPDVWRLEPYKNGVLALIEQKQGSSALGIRSACIFCEQDNPKKVYLLLGETLSKFHENQDWLRDQNELKSFLREPTVTINGRDIYYFDEEQKKYKYTKNTEDHKIMSIIFNRKDDGTIQMFTKIVLSEQQLDKFKNDETKFFMVHNRGTRPTHPMLDGWYPLNKMSPGSSKIIIFALKHCI